MNAEEEESSCDVNALSLFPRTSVVLNSIESRKMDINTIPYRTEKPAKVLLLVEWSCNPMVRA